MNKFLASAITALFLALPAMAKGPFNGLLLDGQMQPVKKVRIYVKSRNIYTLSDKHGRFGLSDVAPDDTITIELKRKEKIRIPVDGRMGMRIILAGNGEKPRAEYDRDIADTGYGYVKRREYTGSNTGISGEKLIATGENDLLGALRGMIAGLNISGSRGNYTVNIRGPISLNLSSEPLYIVDGVDVPSLDFVSVYDVEYVEVLKDATMYGSKGAAGAILVTTKKGPKK